MWGTATVVADGVYTGILSDTQYIKVNESQESPWGRSNL